MVDSIIYDAQRYVCIPMMVIWDCWGENSDIEVGEARELDIDIGFSRDREARDFLKR